MLATNRAMVTFAAVGFLLAMPAVSGSTAAALNYDDIVDLKLAGVSEQTILRVVEVERPVIFLSVDQIIELKEVGASEALIRELMDTPERFGRDAYDQNDEVVYVYDDDDDWADEYRVLDSNDYSTVFNHYYYDPFAYYWYPWPRSYVYYSPFWWSRAGFYFAGHWCWDWWDPWGPSSWYCNAHYGYGHHFGPSRTRPREHRTWHRARSATPLRAERQRSIYHRAGATVPRELDRDRTRRSDLRTERIRSRTTEGSARSGYRTIDRSRSRTGSSAQRRTSDRTVVRSRTQRERNASSQTREPEYRERSRRQESSRTPRTPSSTREARAPSRSRSSGSTSTPRAPESNSSGSSSTERSGGSGGGSRTRGR